MTAIQKIIKYCAVAFALFLIVTIISSVLGVFYIFAGVLGLKEETDISNSEMDVVELEKNNIDTLDIDISYANLSIKSGESLKIDTNSEDIKCVQNGDELQIEEKDYIWFSNSEEKQVVLYIPESVEFEKIKIITGAGKVEIENIITENMSLELGAGETNIQNLDVSKKCDIDGGAGKISILSGEINDLNLNLGVGEANLNSSLTGKCEIDSGIGNLNIALQGNKNDYEIKTDKGLGSIKIDGQEIENNSVYGNGNNIIDIDSGIGNININFK